MEIKKILNGIYNNKSLRDKVIPCFLSNPGLNKSTEIRQFAKEKGVKLVPLVLSQRSPNEISGTLMPSDNSKMSYFDYDLLTDMKEGDILFVDEVLNANTTVLNACLTILMERELISGKKLPSIMIVAASNPQGATRLTPQQKQRFVFYDYKLNKTTFKKHLQDKYQLLNSQVNIINKLVNEESFVGKKYNFSSARSLDLAIEMIIADIPSPYYNVLEPVLNTLVKNELEENITLNDGSIFHSGETLPWITLKQKEQ